MNKALIMASATKMLTKIIDDAKKQHKEEIIEYLNSDEVEKKIAEWMDEKVNIPFVKDEKEAPIFRDIADIMQKLMMLILGKF